MAKRTIISNVKKSKFPAGSVGMFLENMPKALREINSTESENSKKIQDFFKRAIGILPGDLLKKQINDSDELMNKIYVSLKGIIEQDLTIKEVLNIINQKKQI